MAVGIARSNGDPSKDYPGKVTRYVVFSCIVAAFGGLMFGYDLGISGGVTSMDSFLKEFFPDVYRKQEGDTSTNQYCKFDSQILTAFTSSLYLAALVASWFAAWVTKNWGRRSSMIFGGVVFLFGSILNAAAVHVSMLIIGRLLLGVGVGFATQSIPVYVSEMAPHRHRGSFNVIFQLAITIGILLANLVNYYTAEFSGGWGWRVSLGGAGVIAAIIIFFGIFVSETPNSLIERQEHDKAKEMLKRIRGVDDVQAEYNDLVEASVAAKRVKSPWRDLIGRKYRPQLVLGVLIPFFQQLTGINVVMFYAPVLFKTIGFGSDASLMSAVITGGVNVVATFVAIYGTDKFGRRNLFMVGGFQMLIFQIFVATLIAIKFGASGVVTNLPSWYAILVVVCICCYVAAFAYSWGPLGWLVPSEIYPLEIRSAAQSVTVSTNMFFTFLVGQLFLKMLCTMKYGLFIFFACFVMMMTVFVYFFVPETKNIPIEEMTRVWEQNWFWRRFVVQSHEVDGDLENQKRQKTDLI